MKKIFVRLIRLVFLALMLMPAVVLLSHVLLGDLSRGVYGFGCAMFAGMLVTFLPAYVEITGWKPLWIPNPSAIAARWICTMSGL